MIGKDFFADVETRHKRRKILRLYSTVILPTRLCGRPAVSVYLIT